MSITSDPMCHDRVVVVHDTTPVFFFFVCRETPHETRRTLHRTGKELAKRNLTLVDDTCTEISMTIWGEKAKESGEQWEGNPVVAWKGVKVSPCLYFLFIAFNHRWTSSRAAGPVPCSTALSLIRGRT